MEAGEYKDLISRVDERTNALYRDLNEIKENIEKIREADIKKLVNQQSILDDIAKIKENIEKLNREIQDEYVKKVEFTPVQKAVFAVISFIVMAVVSALVSNVVGVPIIPGKH